MAIRCDFYLNGENRKVVMVPQPEETREHVALRLSAFLLFWAYDPNMELSMKHPALAGQEFRPDLIALKDSGEIAVWIECGNVSLNKLDKLTRRCPWAKIAVIKASEFEGQRLRRDLRDEVPRQQAIDVWAWPKEAFGLWLGAVQEREKVEVVGEAEEGALNLVVNEVPLAVSLIRIPV